MFGEKYEKIYFFPLWKIEELEKELEELESKGYRTVDVKYSYWFYFKESKPKDTSYFLSYISPKGQNMSSCDYAILSEHKGQPVNHKSCYYELFRTTEPKSNLDLLYGIRANFIKYILSQKIFISLFMLLLLSALGFAGIITDKGVITENLAEVIYLSFCIAVCLFFSVYYIYGYIKQCKKIKQWENSHKEKP